MRPWRYTRGLKNLDLIELLIGYPMSSNETPQQPVSPQDPSQQDTGAQNSEAQVAALTARINQLELALGRITERNRRVEADKAWETSYTRILFLLGLTYVMTSIVFRFIDAPAPLLNAFIPTLGFWLSVQSLPLVKRWWCRRNGSHC